MVEGSSVNFGSFSSASFAVYVAGDDLKELRLYDEQKIIFSLSLSNNKDSYTQAPSFPSPSLKRVVVLSLPSSFPRPHYQLPEQSLSTSLLSLTAGVKFLTPVSSTTTTSSILTPPTDSYRFSTSWSMKGEDRTGARR